MRALGRHALAAVPLLLLTGCAAEPVTKQAKEINTLYTTTTAIAIVIWLGVTGAILWSIVRFRRKPGDDVLPPQTHGNTTAEIIWTVIPVIIVLILFVMSYATLRSVDKVSADPKDTAAIIHVRGYQWSWEFDYGPDANGTPRVVASGQNGEPPTMVVPYGETVQVVLTSDNVLHSWFVPNFLFKKDVLVGKANRFEFRVDVPGTYKGQCAELCGTDHAKMTFEVKAVSRADFDKFLATVEPPGCKGDEQASATLEIASPPGKIAFDKQCLVAPAGQPVTIKYTHQGGTGQPHNVAIRSGQEPGQDVRFGGPTGPARTINDNQSIEYKPPALPAGRYIFYCEVHPLMRGEYLVKEGA